MCENYHNIKEKLTIVKQKSFLFSIIQRFQENIFKIKPKEKTIQIVNIQISE